MCFLIQPSNMKQAEKHEAPSNWTWTITMYEYHQQKSDLPEKKHVNIFFCVGADHTIAFSAQPRKAARICENGLDMFLHSSTAHYIFLSITDTYTHVNDVFPRSNVGRSHANHAPKPIGKLFFPGEMNWMARTNRL